MRLLSIVLGVLLLGLVPVVESMAQNPPAITLVVPKHEGGYVTPTSPVLYATASPGNTVPASTVVRVDFLDGDTVIGSVAAPNSVPTGYAFVWQNAPPGMHLVAARATDSLGFSTTTSAVPIYIVGPDPPPAVSLTTPSTGQIFAPPNAVPLAATATSPAGSVQRVEFVTADRVIATALSPPYAATWSNPPPGNFAIVAKAYDDIGVAATSPAAYIQVLPAPRTPVIVLTAPAPGTTVPSGSALQLAATALAPDGSIGRVEFYAGTTLLGSSAHAPYQYSWASPSPGTQRLIARGYDQQGFVGASAPIDVVVSGIRRPTVAIASPSSSGQFTAPATIALAAVASEPGGTVTKVEYFANNIRIATTTAPFSATWSNVRAGTYALYAVATDSVGTTSTSSTIAVFVKAPLPTVAITTPQAGTTYAVGQGIVITAHAGGAQGGVSRVEFYSDGKLISAAPVSGRPSAIDVAFTWTNAAVGAHSLSAKVVTTDGASATSSSVNVTVSDFKVTLIEPFAGQVYQVPGDIRITASPSEPGGAITQIDFYGDGALIGSRTSPPYTFLWSGVGAGAHAVSVKARDGAALTASSAPANVTVAAAPTLQVDAGIDGGTVNDDNVFVSGNVQAPQNSAVTVNGVLAVLDPSGNFFVNGLPLQPGANTVSLSLSTLDGHTISRNIALSRSGQAPFEVTIDKQEGIVPFDARLKIVNRTGAQFKRIEVDTNGDGVADLTFVSLTNNVQEQLVHFQIAGAYTIGVKVIDAGNNVIYSAKRRVYAWDPNVFATRTTGVYSGMLDQLRKGNVSGALLAVTGSSNARFRDVFAALGADLSMIVDQMGTIRHVTFNEQVLQIHVVRQGAAGAQTFMINLLRGEDGIWRIEDM